mmetsp:Transcript_6631/g.13453  ORF Transcript_6631/g.13453 Transcript_6631/m.13453 type:complete len:283 (+) Transcript_6631:82-930(+)|eukprot:CAMPEP_0184683282 /NCGR_PEP_ID=MMETSP0312-20130426/10620_1 /TAXON_ID=31354 /ORGANISM="Compsopogon coeruleus, Strain SAG 36.94" /LENGTH=282 /DNA_ID=CAMNT_0027135497 /DNA_START=56 /DNA_END=904 /DNA_ORIENTATION=+
MGDRRPQIGSLHGQDIGLQSWWTSVPAVTRFMLFFVASEFLGTVARFISLRKLLLLWDNVIFNFEIWRPLTALFTFGQPDIWVVLMIYEFYHYSSQVEKNEFLGNVAEYVWMLVVCAGLLFIVSVVISPMPVLGLPMSCAIMQYWGMRNKTQQVKVLIVKIPGAYVAWGRVALVILVYGVVPWFMIYGIMAGHFFYFMEHMYPTLPGKEGARPLRTPAFMYRMCANIESSQRALSSSGNQGSVSFGGGAPGASTGVAGSITSLRQRVTGGHVWGTGQRLGET